MTFLSFIRRHEIVQKLLDMVLGNMQSRTTSQ